LIDTRDIFRISKHSWRELIHPLYAGKSGRRFSIDSSFPVKSVGLNLSTAGELTSADINVNGKNVKLEPKLDSAAKPLYLFSDDRLTGSIAVIPAQINGDKRWNVIYLSEIATNNPIIQLYLLEEISPYFRLVYPAESKITPNRPRTNEIKIWEINSPDGIKTNPDYLLVNDRLYFVQKD
jgi:hypothetical protein